MEIVHDRFGPQEARNLAYNMRKDGHEYDSYGIANGVILDKDGESINGEDAPGLKDWIAGNYRSDLEKIRDAYAGSMKIAEEDGDQKSAIKYKKLYDSISEYLSRPHIEPEEDGQTFHATMQAQNISFVHCWDVESVLSNKTPDPEVRLYMCPRADNMTNLIDEYKRRCDENGQQYYFKFATDASRYDRFIIYTNYEQVDSQIEILGQIQDDRPELFTDMDDDHANPFWGKIDGAPDGVYFGEEPADYPRPHDYEVLDAGGNPFMYIRPSYSGIRSEMFDRALIKWAEEVYGEKHDDGGFITENGAHFDSPEDIAWNDAVRLDQLFREELDKSADINPDNICFDKYPERGSR